RAPHMRLRVELCCKFLARASGARAIGAAGLGHEAVDHAVEHDAVIEALACQLLDARDMIGREVGAHLDDDAALRRIHDQRVFGVLDLGHSASFHSSLSKSTLGGTAETPTQPKLHRAIAGKSLRRAHRLAPSAHYWRSASTYMRTILSGLVTRPDPGSPLLILSTCSMPSITCPQTVYFPSRCGARSNMMKNWLLALLGSAVRAAPTTPRSKGVGVNSAGRSSYFDPPLPSPLGSPVCAMKPSITRWNVRPS